MRRYTANYVFTLEGDPIRNGIVEVDSNGVITDVIDPRGEAREMASTEYHNGVILPGFINTHCHTELSNLKGKLQHGNGLANFVDQVRKLRNHDNTILQTEYSIDNALREMTNEGIVAAIDICNTASSFDIKKLSRITFHNLIEVLGLDPLKAKHIVNHARIIRDHIAANGRTSLTPHSVYSLSKDLWEQIHDEIANATLLSIHYAESADEALMTEKQEGTLASTFASWGLPVEQCPGLSPLQIIRKYLPREARTIFVHNTYLGRNEAKEISSSFPNAYFALCPESNQLIEGAMPNISMLMDLELAITIGTDSLASVSSLSVINQLKLIQDKYPQIPFNTLLRWATANGAEAMGLSNELGSIKQGKRPGLNLIYPFDFDRFCLSPDSKVRVLA